MDPDPEEVELEEYELEEYELEDELVEALDEELSRLRLDELLVLELPLDEVDRELWLDDELGRWGFSKRSSAPPACAASENVDNSAIGASRTGEQEASVVPLGRTR
jgi:hypothetical protein